MPSIRDRVISVVATWSGVNFTTNEPLENIWGRSASASAIPFKPQAVFDLIEKLDSEFNNPNPDTRDLSSWSPVLFAPPSGIKTVDDLVTAVFVMPEDLAIRRFSESLVRNKALTSAIAKGVVKELSAKGLQLPKKAKRAVNEKTSKRGRSK